MPLKRFLFLLSLGLSLLGSAPVQGSIPENIAGKFLRIEPYITNTRTSLASLAVFGADQSYRYVFTQSGSVFDNIFGYIMKVGYNQNSDGTYAYQKIDAQNATLVLTATQGVITYSLHFQTDTTGTFTATGTGLNVSAASTTGFALLDANYADAAPLSNTALRGRVGSGQSLIAGIVIPGNVPRQVLIRAVGPSLTSFGVTDGWADPDFQIYRGSVALTPTSSNPGDRLRFAHYGDWSVDQGTGQTPGSTASAFQKLFAFLGAFPLIAGSKDSADVVYLDPGAYTIVCSAKTGDAGGEALIEVYLLP